MRVSPFSLFLCFLSIVAGCSSKDNPLPQSVPTTKGAPRAATQSGSSWSITKIAGIYSPTGVALDLAGNVFVASSQRGIIAKISHDGSKQTLVKHLNEPYGLALYNGFIYVAESGAARVDQIAPNGRISQIGRIWVTPRGLAVDRAGNLYVTDSGSNSVFKVSRSGSITQLRPSFDFGAPYGVAVDSNGTVYVTSAGNNAVYRVPSQGPVVPIGSNWNSPFGIAIGKTDTIFVANFKNNEITEMQGSEITQIPGKLGFGRPMYVTVDRFGSIFVTSHGKRAVFKLTPT